MRKVHLRDEEIDTLRHALKVYLSRLYQLRATGQQDRDEETRAQSLLLALSPDKLGEVG